MNGNGNILGWKTRRMDDLRALGDIIGGTGVLQRIVNEMLVKGEGDEGLVHVRRESIDTRIQEPTKDPLEGGAQDPQQRVAIGKEKPIVLAQLKTATPKGN